METKLLANLGLVAMVLASSAIGQTLTSAQSFAAISMDQLGVVAGKQYQGDGLSVSATVDGARVRCSFQQLEGSVTADGLWLRSTVDGSSGDRFRVKAVKVSRATPRVPEAGWPATDPLMWPQPTLASAGIVKKAGNVACFIRDGLTEEYSVSMDGVRQDFIIEQRPEGEGELHVELAVTGAKAEPLVDGVRLVLDNSGRKLVYNRLRVVDTRGQELTARLDVKDAMRLAVLVDDAAAIYPVRIDPTFSDSDWISMGAFSGTDNNVNAAAVDIFGNLFIGGNFSTVGNIVANRIAKWDGSVWTTLESGLNSEVLALAVSGNNVYVGGRFTSAGGIPVSYIAGWNGTSWAPVGSGMNNYVRALAVSSNTIYAGGDFTLAGGNSANYVAKWDGGNWTAMGSGMNDTVSVLVESSNEVYAGGSFTTAGGGVLAAHRVAKWNGSIWTTLGSGMNNDVNALAVSGGDLYAGGRFTLADGVPANRIAKWNGVGWGAIGSGINGNVNALTMSGTNVYAGGFFTSAGGVSVTNVAKWNGTSWSGLGVGLNGTINTITALGSDVFVGGFFTASDDVVASRVARWNGSVWSGLATNLAIGGLGSEVNTIVISGTNLFVGGYLRSTSGSASNYVVKWDGSMWLPLGAAMNGRINVLVLSGANLYAGGAFNAVGGMTANRIAKWDGNDWSAVGSLMPGIVGDYQVKALAVSNGDLYAGGFFHNVGGEPTNYIARWNGSSWTTLGSGMNFQVSALALSDTNLYAGGDFTIAGGIPASRIAKWNGNNWASMGFGLNGPVYALAVLGSDLYAGGSFTRATNSGGSSVSVSRIAKWDGSLWSGLGAGVDSTVRTMTMSGTDLFAGGDLIRATNVGGLSVVVNRIAKWDGNEWSALGSGVNGSITALTAYGTHLYVGGGFTVAGASASAYVAKANIGAARGRFRDINYSSATGFSCIFLDASVSQPYRIQTSPSLTAGNWTDFTNFTYTAPIVITDASAVSATNKFFRAVTP